MLATMHWEAKQWDQPKMVTHPTNPSNQPQQETTKFALDFRLAFSLPLFAGSALALTISISWLRQ